MKLDMLNGNNGKVHAPRSTLEIQSSEECNFDVGMCKNFSSIDVTDRDGIEKTFVSVQRPNDGGLLPEVFKKSASNIFGVSVAENEVWSIILE
jgi:hypothetical protein